MQARDVINDVRAMIDEYTSAGVVLDDSRVSDIIAKSMLFINKGQQEIVKLSKYRKVFEKTFKPITNLVQNPFEVREFVGNTVYIPDESGVKGAYAYNLDVDMNCTVEMQELKSGVWTTTSTVTPQIASNELYTCKGTITKESANNSVRIKLSGSEYGCYTNVALYDKPYSASKLPDYGNFIKVKMPDDFSEVDQLVEQYPSIQYQNVGLFRWEGFKDLYISHAFDGTIRIIYVPVPTKVYTQDDVLSVDDNAAHALAYYVLANVAPHEMETLTNIGWSKWTELKAEIGRDAPANETEIYCPYVTWGD